MVFDESKRLSYKPKDPNMVEVRGTEQASELVDLMVDNWDQLQDKYKNQSVEDREEMMDHFNGALNNLGDTLFGDDATPDDFRQFVGGLEDEQE